MHEMMARVRINRKVMLEEARAIYRRELRRSPDKHEKVT